MSNFSFTIESNHLSKGLRPSKRMPRNSRFLVECAGAVGRDGVLQTIDELDQIDVNVYMLDFDNQSGTFTIGNTVTGGTSGATSDIVTVTQVAGSGTLYLQNVSGIFEDDEVLTESVGNTADADGVASLEESFPFPQIFVFTKVIIVCGETKIYEWIDDALVLKLTVTAGSKWNAVDFHEYVYLSNAKVSVERNALSKVYSTTTDLPTCMAACNFNGQVIIGASDVDGS